MGFDRRVGGFVQHGQQLLGWHIVLDREEGGALLVVGYGAVSSSNNTGWKKRGVSCS
jgi:hypothetical protein